MKKSSAAKGSSPKLTRRRFLQAAGTAAISSAFVMAGGQPKPVQAALPAHPNLLFVISDQERYPQHWPANWADNFLTNHKRLADQGISFNRFFCNTTMCSPSRATLFTGLYPAQHGLTHTGSPDYQLPPTIQTMGHMLASAGYNVQLRGKWHLSYDNSVNPPVVPPTQAQVQAYGFNGWQPTIAGDGQEIDGYGDGCAQNDVLIAQQAVDFLYSPSAKSGTPFALFVTLVNPHDVLAYPNAFDSETCANGNQYNASADFTQGINLSDTLSYDQDDLSTKPQAQARSKALFASGLGALASPPSLEPRNYINFYAYLHTLVDARLGNVLDALDANGLTNDTVVIYTSDHGEMGLAHNGLRQKMYNAYEETMRVPLLISNPVLFSSPVTTSSLASLIDLMPTVASLANVPNRGKWQFRGFDLSPLFTSPTASVQDAILFTFDDEDAGQATPPPAGLAVPQPNHIRCIREANWKYARYFDPAGVEAEEYELYDLANDPDELVNLYGDPSAAAAQTALAGRLAQLERTRLGYPVYLPQITR